MTLSASLVLFVIQYLLGSVTALDSLEHTDRISSASCNPFEERRVCGPSCPVTCDTLKTEVCCDVKCVPGCFCRDGYMLVSNVGPRRCVPIDGCPKPGILDFANLTLSVLESGKAVVIAIQRLNGSSGVISVRWRTVRGTAREDLDFVPSRGILEFQEGETFGFISIRIVDDSIREPDEYFSVVLSDPTNKAEINPRRLDGVRIVITDDDMKPGYVEVLNTSITVPENFGTVSVTLLRIGGTDGLISIHYRTVERTAQRLDYVPVNGVVNFQDGEDRKTVNVRIINDDITEPMETFQLEFFDPSAATGVINFRQLSTRLTTIITILDDDMRPGYIEVELGSITVPENVGTVNVTLIRLQGADGQIRIKYKTVDGSAVARLDYLPVTGDIVFNDGETRKVISLAIIDDDQREPVENIRLQLFDPSVAPGVINFRSLSTRLETTIIILDNDMRPGYIEVELTQIPVAENIGTVNVTLVRVGGTDGQIRIKYRTVDGTARASVDYTPISGNVIFNEGEKIKVISLSIIDDDQREPTENIRLQLFDPAAATDVINFRSLSTRLETTIVIMDNDMNPGFIELPNPVITIPESIGVVKLNVVRFGGRDGEIRIRYKTVDDTASAQADYTASSGELIFAEGETLKEITISILNDELREPAESFRIELFEASAAPGVINFRGMSRRTSTIITIVDDDMRPGYIELEKVNYTVKENAGTLQITVVRLGGTDGVLLFKYKTIDVTASAQTDYRPAFGDLVFENGESRKTVSINILNDDQRESLETFRLQIYDITPGAETINFRSLGSKLSTLITILDDDERPGYVEMGEPSLSVPENVGSVAIPVVRLDGSDGVLRVPYKILDVSAIAGLDYRPVIGEIVFRDGETRQTISITVIDDQLRETVETFRVQLLDLRPQLGQLNFRRVLGSRLTTVVSILDNDAKPGVVQFERSSLTIREDAGVAEITVLRIHGTDGDLLVKYKVVSGTATASADFTIADGELAFQDGADRLTLKIKIIDDRVKEPDETFSILIYEPDGIQGRRLGQTTSLLVTIIDNDIFPGVFEFQTVRVSVPENAGSLPISIIRRDGSDGQVSLQVRTRSGTAADGADFSLRSQTVLFPDGVTEGRVDVQILDDDIKENDESFLVGLFSPTNGGVLGENNMLTVVIVDDDEPSVIRFQRRSGNFRESVGLAEIPVVRENGLGRQVSIRWRTEDLSARAGEDYSGTPDGLLVFEANERAKTIRIAIVDDIQFESNELFDVVLFDPSRGAVLGVPSRYTVELSDNDARASTQQPSLPKVPNGMQISFRVQLIRVRESAGEVRISIVRSGALSLSLTVSVRTVDGTAIGGRDYGRTRGPIRFGAGDEEIAIRIRIIDDDLPEPDEVFTVELFDPSAGIIPLGLNVATVTIEDDDGNVAGQRNENGAIAVPRPRPTPGSAGSSLLTSCPSNLILKTCADTCPPTCDSVFGRAPCSFNGCIRGCFCPQGLVKENEQSERCIKPSQCPRPPQTPCSKCRGSSPIAGSQSQSGLLGLF